MFCGLFAISAIIANIHSTIWIMFLVLFLPYIAEYIVSLYTLKNVVSMSSKKKAKKLEKLQKQNADSKKIEELEEEIKHNDEFLKNYKEKENCKIIISKNENVKWLILVMIITALGALVTPIRINSIYIFHKNKCRKFFRVY